MTKMNIPDADTKRVGAIMHNARMVCHMSRDELSDLLNIMPNDLAEYEHGRTVIPADVLERVFIMGYSLMRIRVLENRYRCQRAAFRKIKQVVKEVA